MTEKTLYYHQSRGRGRRSVSEPKKRLNGSAYDVPVLPLISSPSVVQQHHHRRSRTPNSRGVVTKLQQQTNTNDKLAGRISSTTTTTVEASLRRRPTFVVNCDRQADNAAYLNHRRNNVQYHRRCRRGSLYNNNSRDLSNISPPLVNKFVVSNVWSLPIPLPHLSNKEAQVLCVNLTLR